MDLSYNTTFSDRPASSDRSVLLTQGITPFAQRIAARYLPQWKVVFASSADIPQPLLDAGRHVLIPNPNHASFIHELLKICLSQQVGYLLPLDREEATVLSGAKVLFQEYGIEVLVSDPEIRGELPVMLQPPRGLDLVIMSKGEELAPASGMKKMNEQYSGVFCFNDDGEGFQCYT